MSREILKIAKFEGGINNYSDEKDIEKDQSVDLVDVDISKVGTAMNMGGAAIAKDDAGNNIGDVFTTLTPGYGLHTYATDATFLSLPIGTGSTPPKLTAVYDVLNVGTSPAQFVWGWLSGGIGAYPQGDNGVTFTLQFNDGVTGTENVSYPVVCSAGPPIASAILGLVETAVDNHSSGSYDFTALVQDGRVVLTSTTNGTGQNGGTLSTNVLSGGWDTGESPSTALLTSGTADVALRSTITVTAPDTLPSGDITYSINISNNSETRSYSFASNATSAETIVDGLIDVLSNGAGYVDDGNDGDFNIGPGNDRINITKVGTTQIQLDGVTVEDGPSPYGFGIGTSISGGFNRFDDGNDAHIVHCASNGTVKIWSQSIKAWQDPSIDISTDSSGVKGVFYSDAGALRISDATLSSNLTSKWFGYILQDSIFNNAIIYSDWAVADHAIAGIDNYVRDGFASGVGIPPSDGPYVQFNIRNNSTPATSENLFNGNYRFHVSAIFDGYQDTLIFKDSSLITFDGINQVVIDIGVRYEDDNGQYAFNRRITAFRLWYSKEEDGYGTKYALLDLDFKDGVIRRDGGSTSAWTSPNTHVVGISTDIVIDGEYDVDYFEALNGYSPENSTINVDGWKTSTISGRRCYLGNVKQDGLVFNDRILVSPVNRFDIFPKRGIMEVAINDGEEIIELESYADRLLQFKRNTLYIINISEPDAEFVEETHRFKGVISPNHVCWSQHGICWVNENGAFLYDGEEVKDLLEKEGGGRRISDSTWRSFINANTAIGYTPDGDKLIVKRSADGGNPNAGDVYVYEFIVEAWTFGKERWNNAEDCSNFANMQDGQLIIMRHE